MGTTRTLQELKELSDTALVHLHDHAAKQATAVQSHLPRQEAFYATADVNYYLAEIRHREIATQTNSMLEYTRTMLQHSKAMRQLTTVITWLTVVVTGATVVNLIVFLVRG
jgi:cell division protein FtsX